MKPLSTSPALPLVIFASLACVNAARAIECSVKANRVVSGVPTNAGFGSKSGNACTPRYRAQPGYTGSDAFVIEATANDTRGASTSVVTQSATVR